MANIVVGPTGRFGRGPGGRPRRRGLVTGDPPATTGRRGRSPLTAPAFRGWSWPPSPRTGRSSAGSASTSSASRGHRHPERRAADARERPEERRHERARHGWPAPRHPGCRGPAGRVRRRHHLVPVAGRDRDHQSCRGGRHAGSVRSDAPGRGAAGGPGVRLSTRVEARRAGAGNQSRPPQGSSVAWRLTAAQAGSWPSRTSAMASRRGRSTCAPRHGPDAPEPGAAGSKGLFVYDVDSDVTIVVPREARCGPTTFGPTAGPRGPGRGSRGLHRWRELGRTTHIPASSSPGHSWGFQELWSYDVETDTWTPIHEADPAAGLDVRLRTSVDRISRKAAKAGDVAPRHPHGHLVEIRSRDAGHRRVAGARPPSRTTRRRSGR